jgi:hypothetical protein
MIFELSPRLTLENIAGLEKAAREDILTRYTTIPSKRPKK